MACTSRNTAEGGASLWSEEQELGPRLATTGESGQQHQHTFSEGVRTPILAKAKRILADLLR